MGIDEAVNRMGTYAAVKFSKKTTDSLLKFCKDNGITNALIADEFHTTVLYSRKHLPTIDIDGELLVPVIGTPTEFVVWETRSDDKKAKPSRCLVLKYDCKALCDRHNELMSEYKATYDFDEYHPHISLSYDIGTANIDHLQVNIVNLCDIEIVSEYSEDLNLDWVSKK